MTHQKVFRKMRCVPVLLFIGCLLKLGVVDASTLSLEIDPESTQLVSTHEVEDIMEELQSILKEDYDKVIESYEINKSASCQIFKSLNISSYGKFENNLKAHWEATLNVIARAHSMAATNRRFMTLVDDFKKTKSKLTVPARRYKNYVDCSQESTSIRRKMDNIFEIFKD